MKKMEYIIPLIEIDDIDSENVLSGSTPEYETEEQYAKRSTFEDDKFDEEEEEEIPDSAIYKFW